MRGGIDHVMINCNDFEAAVRFYSWLMPKIGYRIAPWLVTRTVSDTLGINRAEPASFLSTHLADSFARLRCAPPI